MCKDDTNHRCLQSSDFYVCEFLFDEMVKINFSRMKCHEEIIILATNYTQHLYSMPLNFFRERVISAFVFNTFKLFS